MQKDDVIYRQAAIDGLKKIPDLTVYAYCSFLDMLMNMPSAQPEPQWIPCSERLPDKEDIYLCCSTAQDIWILRYMMPYYFKAGAFIQFDGDYPVEFSDVIAWMPLPEPYAERRTDGND